MTVQPTHQQNYDSANLTQKVNLLLESIKRYDAYIVSTNAKASLIIAFNSVILAAVLFEYGEILSLFQSDLAKLLANIFIIGISIASIISLILVFRVVYPFLGERSNNSKKSLIFYGDVSKISGGELSRLTKSVSLMDIIDDLSNQAVILSIGLLKKMQKMRESITAIIIELVLILFMIVLRAWDINFLN